MSRTILDKNHIEPFTKFDVGLGDVDNTSDLDKPLSTATLNALNNKVDKEIGKGLFTGSYNDLIDKPSIPSKTSHLLNDSNFIIDSDYIHTDNNFSTTLKNKLDGISSGAEVNVQANWDEIDNTKDEFIKNKPTIPSKTSELNNDSGFITSETDPLFTNSPAYGITNDDITNWNEKQTSLGYTPENIVNRLTTFQNIPDDNHYISEKLAKDSLDSKVDKVTGKVLSSNDLTDTLKTNYDNAYQNSHVHTNKEDLDMVSGINTGNQDLSGLLTDSPSDGSIYGRKNGSWEKVIGGSSTFSDITGNPYDNMQLAEAFQEKISIAYERSYNELDILCNSNGLHIGQSYILTDFRTKYTIPELEEIHTGNLERLLLVANTTNGFEKRVYSLDYPLDTIDYEFVDTKNSGDRGRIIYREFNGSFAPEDWRNTVFARFYNPIYDSYCDVENNGGEYQIFPGFVDHIIGDRIRIGYHSIWDGYTNNIFIGETEDIDCAFNFVKNTFFSQAKRIQSAPTFRSNVYFGDVNDITSMGTCDSNIHVGDVNGLNVGLGFQNNIFFVISSCKFGNFCVNNTSQFPILNGIYPDFTAGLIFESSNANINISSGPLGNQLLSGENSIFIGNQINQHGSSPILYSTVLGSLIDIRNGMEGCTIIGRGIDMTDFIFGSTHIGSGKSNNNCFGFGKLDFLDKGNIGCAKNTVINGRDNAVNGKNMYFNGSVRDVHGSIVVGNNIGRFLRDINQNSEYFMTDTDYEASAGTNSITPSNTIVEFDIRELRVGDYLEFVHLASQDRNDVIDSIITTQIVDITGSSYDGMRLTNFNGQTIFLKDNLPSITTGDTFIGIKVYQMPLAVYKQFMNVDEDFEQGYTRIENWPEYYLDSITNNIVFRRDIYSDHNISATTFKPSGDNPVADGTYTVGIGETQNGTITVKGGIIIEIQEAI